VVVRDEQQWKGEVAEFRAGKGDAESKVEGVAWVKVEEGGMENVMSISDMDLFTAFSGITYDLTLHDSLKIYHNFSPLLATALPLKLCIEPPV
jgi:hypothetical protein